MLHARWLLALLTLLLPLSFASAETSFTITQTSKTKLDIPLEVAAFYQKLVADHPSIRAEHSQLVEGLREPDSRSPEPWPTVKVVQWVVNSYSRDPRNQDPRSDIELDAEYLTFQPIQRSFHHGYEIPTNLVALFRVSYRAVEESRGPNEKSQLLENSLTITFEGFQSVELKPLKE